MSNNYMSTASLKLWERIWDIEDIYYWMAYHIIHFIYSYTIYKIFITGSVRVVYLLQWNNK